MAAFFALKSFASSLEHCEILLRLDNSTAISYVNKMGGTHVRGLNEIARKIWEWCAQKNILLYASYIPSKENIEADRESRVTNIDTEWELNERVFKDIVRIFGKPETDLFASRKNHKCNLYTAWFRDPGTQLIDAFTKNWSNWFFYAFPPFALILKTLKKIVTDKGRGIIVVPLWPAQPWYPLFLSMLTENPMTIEPSENLLTFDPRTHPLSSKLSLVAGIVSAMPS